MIMVTAVLLSALWLLLLVYAILVQWRPPNYPPGPKWWPFLGNGILLKKLAVALKGQHLALRKLADDYKTSVLGLRLGGDFVVVGFSPSVVREILSRDEFTGRPDSFFIRLRCFGKRQGVTGCDGPLWQQQRAFVVRHLKVFGFGKSAMEAIIQEEVNDLIHFLREEQKPVNLGQVLSVSILNVLWSLVAGKRLQRADGQLRRLLELLNRRSQAFDMAGGLLNQFPWLRFLAPKKTGYKLLTELNAELKVFLTEMVEDHKKNYKAGVTRDLIDAFLHDMHSNADDDLRSIYTDSQLIVVLLDLFIAGSQTTGNTLNFIFLYMLKYPSVQEKVYECLRENSGSDGLFTMADRPRLAYVEAVIAEVQRLCNVVPLTGPRRCLKDTALEGYFIPENSTVLISLWSVHMDESIFPEPEAFLPERFLDSNGRFTQNSNLIPFGLEDRSRQFFLERPGSLMPEQRASREDQIEGSKSLVLEVVQSVADLLFPRKRNFYLLSGIMLNFRISKPPNGGEPSLEPLLGITLAPQEYLAEFIPR